MKFITILMFIFSFNTFAQADCAKYIQELCKDAPAGKISDCFKNNMNKLPARCSNNMNSMQGMAKEIEGDCMEELNKMCPMDISTLTNGGDMKKLVDGMSKCIQKNVGNMSATCRDKFKKINDAVLNGEMDGGSNAKKIR